MEKTSDWIVFKGDLRTVYCDRCGDKFEVARLAEGEPLWVFQALCAGFRKEHIACEKKE